MSIALGDTRNRLMFHRDILIVTILMAAFGILMIFDATAVSTAMRHRGVGPAYFLLRQTIWFGIGTVVFFGAAVLPLARVRGLIPIAFAGVVALLIIVLIPHIGVSAGGARRWLRLGGFSLQPGELVRLALVLCLAHFLDRSELRGKRASPRTLALILLISAPPIVLLALQPKLSTAMICLILTMLLLFVSGIRLRLLLIPIAVAVPVLIAGSMRYGYIVKRLMAWADPIGNRHGVAFQTLQSLIAIGSGGLTGTGLGLGRQKLFYLPEAHTDFIFSVISEELGLLGSTVILSGFIFFLLKGLMIARQAPDMFHTLVSTGLTAVVILPAMVNLLVTVGLFPVTGVSLPLLSFGGSALVTDMASLGLLAGIPDRRFM